MSNYIWRKMLTEKHKIRLRDFSFSFVTDDVADRFDAVLQVTAPAVPPTPLIRHQGCLRHPRHCISGLRHPKYCISCLRHPGTVSAMTPTSLIHVLVSISPLIWKTNSKKKYGVYLQRPCGVRFMRKKNQTPKISYYCLFKEPVKCIL